VIKILVKILVFVIYFVHTYALIADRQALPHTVIVLSCGSENQYNTVCHKLCSTTTMDYDYAYGSFFTILATGRQWRL